MGMHSAGAAEGCDLLTSTLRNTPQNTQAT
jgi:hypothetical protein